MFCRLLTDLDLLVSKAVFYSGIWTFINDIEDCSPYFPLGIGSPSLYISNTKKRTEHDTSLTDLSQPLYYEQIKKELDCFSVVWSSRRDVSECQCGLSFVFLSVPVKNCAVCGRLCCNRCIHRRKLLPGHALAYDDQIDQMQNNNIYINTSNKSIRTYPVCGGCYKDWHL